MFERILHFFRGEVRFTAKNGFSAEFMKACREEHAVLENVDISATEISASVRWRDYCGIIRAAQNSGMLLLLSKQSGLPFILNKYRKRVGIPVGMILFSVILLYLSSILWSIEITGLKTINENSFREYLVRENVKPGVSLGSINCNEIESYAGAFGQNILRVTVNLVGCRLYVNVEERSLVPEISGRKGYCNIVAARDGEILKADVFSGESDLHIGDAVLEGDLLVSGIKTTPGGNTLYVEAKAMILARTYSGITCQTGKNILVKKISSSTDRYSIRLFGISFPRFGNRISCAAYLSADAGIFPLAVIRTHEAELIDERIALNNRKSFLIAMTDLAAASVDMLKNIYVVKSVIHVQTGTQVCVEAQFVCEEDIAKAQYYEILN